MKQQNYTFTKDYLDCIAQASLFVIKKNIDNTEISPDDVFLGVWKYIEKSWFADVFWKMLWSKFWSKMIWSYVDQKFPEDQKFPAQANVKFVLQKSFQDTFTLYKEKWLEKLHFLVLFMSCLDSLSDELTTYLQKHEFDIWFTKQKLEKIIDIIMEIDMTPIEFFQMVHSMVKALWLNISDMEMFFDMSQIEHMETMMSEGIDTLDPWSWWWDQHKTKIDENSKKEEKKLTIEYFSTDLTDEARKWYLDPVIWRWKEIQQIIYTLMRKTKNNPLLIGEAWVGKTAIVEWLAQRIITKDVPQKLQNKRLMMVDIWSLVAWTKYRWEFEARLKAIVEEAMDPTNNIIMFVDEVHTLIWAWNAEWSADAANILKPLLSRWKIQMVWATTFDEYQKHIEKDAALKRRFQEITVDEPSRDDTIAILKWIREKFEAYHGVSISDESIEYSVRYSMRYIMNKHLPDKAIDLIDEACARVSTLSQKLENNSDYSKLEKKIEKLQERIQTSIEKQDYFKAAELKDKEEEMKKQLSEMRSQHTLPDHLRPKVESIHVWQVLSDKMWLPLEQVTESEVKQLSHLDNDLKELIYSQEEAVNAVVRAIRRSRLSPIEHKKPIASFLFLWPSWVGKTYLAKLLAEEYFGDPKALIRVDMSEFMERHSVSKLIWSAPWYVWYDEWWMLTEQVRRKPYSVILFDEIEKASPDILNIMLQILDEWHLKDNKGRWIDFKNTIIIMTSNLWAEEFGQKQVSIWFDHMRNTTSSWAWDDIGYDEMSEEDFEIVKERILAEVKEFMAPELINRLSSMIVFRPLSKDILWKIFKKEFKNFITTWKQKKWLKFPTFWPKKISKIIDEIYDPQLWARPIERYIHDEIEPGLIEQVMSIW